MFCLEEKLFSVFYGFKCLDWLVWDIENIDNK